VRRLINEAIRADEVLLSDENGADLGPVTRAEALTLARAHGCDLVQEGAFSSPPRCHLVPAGHAAAHAARAAHDRSAGAPKEIRVSTAMAAHDVQTRRRQAAGLLARGYTVKLSARLAKAERANPAAARALLEDLARELADAGRVARKPYNEAGALALLLAPREE
jgi:translation initiation factor IF-3